MTKTTSEIYQAMGLAVHERRFRLFYMDDKSFLSLFKEMGKGHGISVIRNHLPEDVVFRGVNWDFMKARWVVCVASMDYDPIQEAGVIPDAADPLIEIEMVTKRVIRVRALMDAARVVCRECGREDGQKDLEFRNGDWWHMDPEIQGKPFLCEATDILQL